MSRQLVLVHGRAQERMDSIALKAKWIESLEKGLAKSSLVLPISTENIRFPYYGDALFDMVDGKSTELASAVIIRGDNWDDDEKRFARALMEEIRQKTGITDAQLAEIAEKHAVERGVLNWEWFQDVLKAIDRFVPYGSGASIALFTRDVFKYLKDSAIRERIDTGVCAALAPGVESVVVSHSLGTVVAYNILRQQGHLRGWKVPLLVTLGSPLAITEIKKTLRSFAPMRCPDCVSSWLNVLDERDVVALYPLDTARFPLNPANPAINNKTDVCNETRNRHGITGYLDDKEVARRIYDALTAQESLK